MSMLGTLLRNQYERLVKASCWEQPFAIPSTVQRYFNNPYAFEYVTAIRTFLEGARRVLVRGDGGGRDYFCLKLLGKQPVVVDFTPQQFRFSLKPSGHSCRSAGHAC